MPTVCRGKTEEMGQVRQALSSTWVWRGCFSCLYQMMICMKTKLMKKLSRPYQWHVGCPNELRTCFARIRTFISRPLFFSHNFFVNVYKMSGRRKSHIFWRNSVDWKLRHPIKALEMMSLDVVLVCVVYRLVNKDLASWWNETSSADDVISSFIRCVCVFYFYQLWRATFFLSGSLI